MMTMIFSSASAGSCGDLVCSWFADLDAVSCCCAGKANTDAGGCHADAEHANDLSPCDCLKAVSEPHDIAMQIVPTAQPGLDAVRISYMAVTLNRSSDPIHWVLRHSQNNGPPGGPTRLSLNCKRQV